MQKNKEIKEDILKKNLENFSKISNKLVETKDVTDLFKRYIKAMNNYNSTKPQT